jgi:hypothetical protein
MLSLATFELSFLSLMSYVVRNADTPSTHSVYNEALSIRDQGCVLTETDVLHASQKSLCIAETPFNIGQLS